MNLIFVSGRLGKAPSLQHTKRGTAVTTFSLADNFSRKNELGEWVDETTWHRIVCWGRQAEAVCEHLRKGSEVTVVGVMTYRKWIDDNEQQRVSAEIKANRVHFHGKRSDRKDDDHRRDEEYGDLTDDDIPF